MLCGLGGELAAAQGTNGIPIVHRFYRYSGHARMLGGTAANLPPPPPSEDEVPVPGQDDIKVNGNLKSASSAQQKVLPGRRPDPRKEKDKDKDPFKSLFVVDNAATNKTDPEIKKWGWLAEEADANRQVLESYRKPPPGDDSWTNGLAGQAETNAAKRAKIGSLKGNAYEPLGAERTSTGNVERVVEDRIARGAEKNKQEDARQKAAQKEGLNMAEKRDLPPGLTLTNETLGLARSHKDDERPDVTLDADFSQTRKAMAEISSRYQLNLTMADIMRRPTAPPPETTTKSIAARNALEKDGAAGSGGDTRRPALGGETTGGTLARAPAPPPAGMPGSGAAWMKPPSGPMPSVNSASAMVEGPKAPKAYEMPSVPAVAAPLPSPNTPAAFSPQSSYTPGRSTSGYTPGGRTPGSMAPSFTPTAPYRNLFDNTPSR